MMVIVPPRKKQTYAILVPVHDTGDLYLEGKFWRVVTTVKAASARAASSAYGRRANSWMRFLVTDYAPALDVAMSREVPSCSS